MLVVGALPSLGDGSIVERVRLVRPDALNKARLVLLVIVEDRVYSGSAIGSSVNWLRRLTERLAALGLDLAVSPSRDLDDVAHDAVVALLGVQGNIVPKGDRLAILFQPHTPFLLIVNIILRSCRRDRY